MSALSAASLSASFTGAGAPAINPATEPESVRRGGEAAKQAYETGLGFESMLVSELAQQLTSTISGSGSDGNGLGGSSDGSSDGSGGSSDPAAGAYSSLLPSALTQGVMSAGGTGVALQIAQSIDPRLALGPAAHDGAATATGSGSSAPASTGAATTGGAGL